MADQEDEPRTPIAQTIFSANGPTSIPTSKGAGTNPDISSYNNNNNNSAFLSAHASAPPQHSTPFPPTVTGASSSSSSSGSGSNSNSNHNGRSLPPSDSASSATLLGISPPQIRTRQQGQSQQHQQQHPVSKSRPLGYSSQNMTHTRSTSSEGSAFEALNGVPDDKSALAQILAGIGDMQRELARLHHRIDTIEERNSPSPSPSPHMRPRSIARSHSNRSFRHDSSRSSSPEKLSTIPASGARPAHLSHLSRPAIAQPAPLLTQEPDLGLWCVVPAGGAGTRLWPLSRESYPKFLLDLVGSGRTLLQSTWDRLLPLCGPRRLMIVTGDLHVDGVLDQLPELSESNVLAEPSPKESMAAIGLAAAVLQRRDPDAVLGSFAADHIISGRDGFESAVTEAVAVARAGYLVTIGIAPSHPSTGFGYIKLGDKLNVEKAPNARLVTEFKEKPDARTASAYLATGNYRWNGGMFVVQAKTLLALLEKSMPELHEGLIKIAAVWDAPGKKEQALQEIWPNLPKIAIDHAVAEPAAKAGKVAVVPATFGWDDVGDFSSLADLIPADEGKARILGDQNLVVTESQAGGLIVPAAGRKIACLGVDDVVVVDTPDALLITTRARSQDVKKIVARCKKMYPELC